MIAMQAIKRLLGKQKRCTMKIITDDPAKMVLTDQNITNFVGGIICSAFGIVIVIFFGLANLVSLAIGIVLILAGVYVVLTTKSVTVILDNEQRKCDILLQSILKKESREFAFDEVKELILKSYMGYSTSNRSTSNRSGFSTKQGKPYYQHSLIFSLKDGGEIPLEFGRVSASIMDVLNSPNEKKRKEAKQISDFIGVELKEVLPPSATEILSTLKEGIAEGISRSQKPLDSLKQ